MVTCRGVLERLGSLVDGDAGWDSAASRHLARCVSCARYLQTYRTTVALAREACREADPADPACMPESLVQQILWSRRARSFASASWRVAHLIGVAASPLIVFSLAR
jgi:anti-sigma factor RsiW